MIIGTLITGLQESLSSILQAIARSKVLIDYLAVAEEVTRSVCVQSRSIQPFDLITAGIWQPIVMVIKERMGGRW